MRVQLALNVRDLDEAVEFYGKLFDAKPNKRKPGYANFAIEQPPLKLVLFENPGAAERLNHLGVEVFEGGDVRAATERLKAAGLADSVEDEQTCCYATQDKVWSLDPQGLRWEWYRLLEDSETFGRETMTAERRPQDPERVREMVQEGYTRVVQGVDASHAADLSRRVGYSDEELEAVPDGANLGVGCGNPTAIDALRAGETVLDLGSGAGMDAFLAARQVGPTGHVIGVDMTEAMLEKARDNARKTGVENVEFRKGQIEALPVEDESVDVILSNCVINLSPEKDRVYREAFRVLRPGGRLMISDVVLERPLPQAVLDSVDAYLGCVGGASLREEYLETVRNAGFREVRVDRESNFADAIGLDDPQVQEIMEKLEITPAQVRDYAKAVISLHLFARK